MSASQPTFDRAFDSEGIFDFTDLDQFRKGHPYAAYKRLRSEAPVCWQPVESPGRGFWVVSRYDDIQSISRAPDHFCSGQGFKALDESYERLGPEINAAMQGILLATDPPDHTAYRRILQPYFSIKQVKALEDATRKMVDEILARLEGKDNAEAIADLSAELPIRVLCHVLGVPESDEPLILDWTNRMVGIDDPDFNPDPLSAAKAFQEVFEYGRNLVADRKKNPGDDLISLVANGEIDGKPLAAEQTDGFFVLMVGAGNETSRNSIAASLNYLDKFPEARQTLIDDPERIPGAIEELLRMISPVIHMRRTATSDTEISGQRIAEGEKVVMLYGSANRDESVFENPDVLDLDRANSRKQFSFGHGIHLCLGAQFARMELKLMLGEFTKRYPNYRITSEPQYLRSHFVHGIKTMQIALA